MYEMFFWYLLIGGIIFLIALSSAVRRTDIRLLLTTILFFIGMGIGYLGLFGLTGAPQPVWLMIERPKVKEAQVLGAYIEEGVGIYILLSAPELGDKPKYFWYPYSTKMAEALEKAQREGRNRGQQGGNPGFFMQNPFLHSLDDRESDGFFHPPPQPRAEPKPAPRQETFTVPTQRF